MKNKIMGGGGGGGGGVAGLGFLIQTNFFNLGVQV